ncbi:MAG: GAF domain-containing protein [Burkholderiales bacterium]
MIKTEDLVTRFRGLMADLRAKTNASRTTLRLDDERHGFFVNGVVAEALGEGVKSIAAETSLQQRKSGTASHLEKHRKILVQSDCVNADPPPPKELMQIYGTKAQMLAPIERDGKLKGWISVHYNLSTREWAPADVAALEAAVAATHRELDAA